MIRHTPTTSTLRFYASADPGPFEPYVAVCTLLWETSTTVWIVGLHGAFSRRSLRELVGWMRASGVTLVKAHRAPDHKLPFGKMVGDHVEMLVADFGGAE